MTRCPDRGQGRKSRLLAKMASPGGTHRTQDAAFPTVYDRIGRYRHLSRRWTGSPGPCLPSGRSRLPRRVPMTEGSGRGRSCITRSHDHRGDDGQDFSTPRRTTHVRRRAGARRTRAGRLRAAQAAAGTAAGQRAAADLHSEPDQPGRSGGVGRAGTHGSGLHTDLPARPGAADGSEHQAGRPRPAPAPACVPICPPSDPGTVQPFAQAAQRCIRIPIPCLPGVDIPGCVNFCPPGQGTPQPTANLEPVPELTRCTPLCSLIPPGSPGACETVPPDRR